LKTSVVSYIFYTLCAKDFVIQIKVVFMNSYAFKAGYRLRAAAARSSACAANSFGCLCVNNRVRVQHRSAAAACGRCSTLFFSHKTVSTERAQDTEIPLPRDKEPLRFGSTRGKFARGNMV
jgi:hypothetical protein